MTPPNESEIRGGIEFFRLPDGSQDEQCARCGSSAVFVDCDNCGGDGEVDNADWNEWDDWEDEWSTCYVCGGSGGWVRCISSRDWCEANPMPGREHIPSSAKADRPDEDIDPQDLIGEMGKRMRERGPRLDVEEVSGDPNGPKIPRSSYTGAEDRDTASPGGTPSGRSPDTGTPTEEK